MPIYEYECQKCNTRLEVFQKINDKPPTRHRDCGGRWERLISAPAIQFKGDGWYVTDYAGKATKKETAESEPAAEKKSEKKKESSPAKKSSEKSSPSKSND